MTDIEMIRVQSTSIHSIGYNPEEKILRVRFLSDLVYDYYDVPETVFDEFLNSPSKGTYLNKEIKDKYNFKKL